ncbi:MAG TPA: hypothetical protein VE133_17730 [Candidatus Sulfotelmatobacter sp.]|nr:hypothetical protein [Candidatus Sulfotelmatobacter sp.]
MTAILAGSLLVALFLLLSIPLLEASSGLSSAANAGILEFAALACLIAGIVLSGHTPEHPQSDSLVYSLNADENSAVWISYDPLPDDWTRRLLTTNPHPPQPLQKYLAGLVRPFLSAKAPVLPLLPPIAENVEHKLERGNPSAQTDDQVATECQCSLSQIS